MANREIVDKNQSVEPFLTKEKLRDALLMSCAAGTFIGFLSPFGMDNIPVQWSIFYWVVTCLCGYFIYMPTIFFGDRILTTVLPIPWCRVALCAIVASVLMSFMIPVITWLIFSIEIHWYRRFLEIFPKTIVIGGLLTVVSMIQDYMNWQKAELNAQKIINEAHKENETKQLHQDVEKFIAMLPLDKRGELICLEMSDHYVKVYTDKGHHLLLMRFKDALKALEQYQGLQTHRSWWVATSAVTALKKEGRKVSIVLTNQLEVPVSKTYADDVKTAGIH